MAKGMKTGGGSRKGKPNKAGQEIREAAREYTSEAIETLAHVMRNATSDQVRVMAADKLLDRGWGRASLTIAGDPENPLVFMHDVARRLDEKLDRICGRRPGGNTESP